MHMCSLFFLAEPTILVVSANQKQASISGMALPSSDKDNVAFIKMLLSNPWILEFLCKGLA